MSFNEIQKKADCVILGGGKHTLMLIECIETARNHLNLIILESNRDLHGSHILGVPVVGDDNFLPVLKSNGVNFFAVGVGMTKPNIIRSTLYKKGIEMKLKPLTIVHSSSIVSGRAVIDPGAQLLPGCIVNVSAKIGCNTIVNSGAVVEHECILGNHVHIATGVRLAGSVVIGNGSHIGVGASVRENIQIGSNALVAAGAVVINDIPDGSVVGGIPAKPLR
jgi:sugar O-acyltransferase (sialic acid O-acetyltransferase NeuD family)